MSVLVEVQQSLSRLPDTMDKLGTRIADRLPEGRRQRTATPKGPAVTR